MQFPRKRHCFLAVRVEIGDDATKVFDGVNLAMLVGARPRTAGMERGDLDVGRRLGDARELRIKLAGKLARSPFPC